MHQISQALWPTRLSEKFLRVWCKVSYILFTRLVSNRFHQWQKYGHWQGEGTQIQKANVFSNCPRQTRTFIFNIFLYQCCSWNYNLFVQRNKEEGKAEAIRTSYKYPRRAQQARCLDALMSWCSWRRLVIWNFKPWRVLYFSTMKRYILRSNFSCLWWRKTLPGSKYLIHQNGMHPSTANWI